MPGLLGSLLCCGCTPQSMLPHQTARQAGPVCVWWQAYGQHCSTTTPPTPRTTTLTPRHESRLRCGAGASTRRDGLAALSVASLCIASGQAPWEAIRSMAMARKSGDAAAVLFSAVFKYDRLGDHVDEVGGGGAAWLGAGAVAVLGGWLEKGSGHLVLQMPSTSTGCVW